MLLHSWFPLIWYETWHCSENVEFWPFDPYGQGGGSAGKIFATKLLHFFIPFNLILTYCPHHHGQGVGAGCTQNICDMMLHSWFPLIWCTTWPCFDKVDFLPFDALGSGWRSAGKLFATILLHFVIPFNLICNMTIFSKIEFWPHHQGQGWGSEGRMLLPCRCICNSI